MAKSTNKPTHWGAQLRTASNGDSVAFMDLSAAKEYQPAKEMKPVMSYRALNWAPWALWGKDNLMPQKMVRDIDSTGILSGIIDGKARFALCEGMVPAIVQRDKESGKRQIIDYVNDPEIQMFMDTSDHFGTSFGCLKDQMGLGSGAIRMMLNKGKDKVAAIKRDDFSFVRYQKQDPANGAIKSVYISAAWDKVPNEKSEYISNIPLLNPYNPLEDLKGKAASGVVEHEFTFSHPGWGSIYYPKPLWYAAHKWVKIAQGVPEMKAAIFENSITVKYVVVIYEQYWEDAYPESWDDMSADEKEAKRNALFDDIQEFLIGAKNTNKTIMVDGKRDLVNGHSWQNIEIKAIDQGKTQSGDMLPDAATANAEIAFSMLFNPNIVGASMSSGPYTNSQGGSNVRESVLLQIIIHELERRNIQKFMNIIKWFNGWAQKYQGLEFIIPATVLTTLDTGASAKPVTLAAGADTTGTNAPETLDDQKPNSATVKKIA